MANFRSMVCAAAAVLGLSLPLSGGPARAAAPTFNFSVLNQRSAALTAEYWNPILSYVARKSGVELRLKIGKTAPETTELTVRGEAQFAFTSGIIAVPAGSPLRELKDLAGQKVAFPSPEAFLGYKVPLDALTKEGVTVEAVFSGNQEGAMGQLKLGRVAAAGVNASVMEVYANRENLAYRALWRSEPFPGLAVMVAPTVPAPVVKAVRDALIGMSADPEGRDILAQGADLLKAERPVGFKAATDADYRSYLKFYRQAAVSP